MAPLQMDGLQAHGIPPAVTEIWRQAVGEQLLPIQEEAVTTYDLFGGGNLLVSAPTSSGKTFIGELAAFHEAYKGGRVVYLVPLRAVAEEKYEEFKEYGVNVIISTGEHREYDEDLLAGNFHLAVVVFEKLLNLSVANPALLDFLTLIVVDECQMISAESRGARLEILLTKIRKLANRPRIIGLSAVAENTGGFDSWLDCKLLAHKERPVELREGVVTNDFLFTYREWNTGTQSSENLGGGANNAGLTLAALCASLLQRGDQILVLSQLRFSICLRKRTIGLSCLVGSVDSGGGGNGQGQVRSAVGAGTTGGTPASDSGWEKLRQSDRPSPDSAQERRRVGGSPGGGSPGCGAGHRVPDQAALCRGGVGEGPAGPAPSQPAPEVG